jgi:hypothetical protein
MFKSRHRAAFAAMVCACVFSACGDPPEKPEGAAPVASDKAPTTKTASIGKDMVAAVSSGKAANVISVHFALRATPTVNTALPVDVAIVPHRDVSSIIVHFDSQDGLAVTTGNSFGPKNDLDSEVAVTHQLVLLPTREGMFMVTCSVDTESVEGNVVRIFSIPVIVTAASAGSPVPTPTPDPPPAPAAGT